jgi:hypothetical protein
MKLHTKSHLNTCVKKSQNILYFRGVDPIKVGLVVCLGIHLSASCRGVGVGSSRAESGACYCVCFSSRCSRGGGQRSGRA